MVFCSISHCGNSSTTSNFTNKGITFHRFPQHPDIKDKWISATGKRQNWFPSSYSRICSKHFKEDDFNITTKRRTLIKTAIPTIDTWKFVFNSTDNQQCTAREFKPKNSKNEDLHDSKNEDLHVSSGDSLENICTEADATNNGAARLEVCVDSLESALNAIHGGADELEVCSLLSEGGLTPTAGLVNSILTAIKKIGSGVVLHRTCPEKCACTSLTKKPKVNVMIRCRSGSDFAYTELEMDTMLEDIEVFKALGPINRFVFGALTQSQQVDEENCTRVIEQATPHSLTFHRAFDVAVNPVESLNSIVNLGFDRLLTSGQCPTADAPEAVELIRTLQTTFANQIEIMPGSGVNAENVTTFMDLGCKIVHSSCKVLKLLPKIEHNYRIGSANSEHIYVTQEAHVREIKDKMLCYAMVKIEIDEINEYTDENVE